MERRTYLALVGAITAITGCSTGDTAEEPTADNNGTGTTVEEETDNVDERSDADSLLSVTDISDLNELPFDPNTIAEFEDTGSKVTDKFDLNSGLTTLVYESENVDNDGLGADLVRTDGDDSHSRAINEVVFYDNRNNVDEITGATMLVANGGEYILDFDTNANWVVHVAQPRAPDEEIRTPPVSVSGQDSAVVGPIDTDHGFTITAEHKIEYEDHTFNVWSAPEDSTSSMDRDISIAGDGGFEGEARAEVSGITWTAIRTRGEWTLEFES